MEQKRDTPVLITLIGGLGLFAIAFGFIACGGAKSEQGGQVAAFASCAEAKDAGYQSMKKGEAGYSARLDGDGDGVACGSEKAFDPQAYCVERLGELAKTYPKSLGDSDLAAECRKMIGETGATSAKTVDSLLATAEGFYKLVG